MIPTPEGLTLDLAALTPHLRDELLAGWERGEPGHRRAGDRLELPHAALWALGDEVLGALGIHRYAKRLLVHEQGLLKAPSYRWRLDWAGQDASRAGRLAGRLARRAVAAAPRAARGGPARRGGRRGGPGRPAGAGAARHRPAAGPRPDLPGLGAARPAAARRGARGDRGARRGGGQPRGAHRAPGRARAAPGARDGRPGR
jgi:hypothetical protein